MSKNMTKFQKSSDFENHTVDMTKTNQLVFWVQVLDFMDEKEFTLQDLVDLNSSLNLVTFPKFGEELANVRYYSGPLQKAGCMERASKKENVEIVYGPIFNEMGLLNAM